MSYLATGGTITTVGGYEIHTFTSSGTLVPSENLTGCNLLVVGGGGGGSGGNTTGAVFGGGGGAAGNIVQQSDLTISTSIAITVGNGGALGDPQSSGGAGQSSAFGSYISLGGNGGVYVSTASGDTGGSNSSFSGGTGVAGTFTPSYIGGPYTSSPMAYFYGGGGAGAGGNGQSAGSAPGHGGTGVSNSISGTVTYYGIGGAGGGQDFGDGGPDGTGAGGNGAGELGYPSYGITPWPGNRGANGVVIVAIPLSQAGGPTSTTSTTTTSTTTTPAPTDSSTTTPAPTISISCGDTLTGTIAYGAADTYTFDGVAKQAVSFSVTNDCELFLYDRLDRFIAQGISNLSATLPTTGQYTLVVQQ